MENDKASPQPRDGVVATRDERYPIRRADTLSLREQVATS